MPERMPVAAAPPPANSHFSSIRYPQPVSGNALGFDYGTKTIGVASGNPALGKASPVGVAKVSDGRPDRRQIRKFVESWQPDRFVVGLPLQADGSESALCADIRRFGKWLEREFSLPVEYVDERLSTEESRRRLASREMKCSPGRKRLMVHQVAAEIILETHFQLRRTHDKPDLTH